MSKIIAITGTPGTGKSTLAKKLVDRLGYERLDISKYYEDISVEYNKEKHCYDIDLKKLRSLVNKFKGKNLIVDSHVSHLLDNVDVCIVLTCSNLKKLEKRLLKRGYSKKKVRENLDAEIFQVCLAEAIERGQKVVVFDTAKKLDLDEVMEKVKGLL